jgi:pyruvate/2-oxoglutarate/acetoin dehydrogenase E1 component
MLMVSYSSKHNILQVLQTQYPSSPNDLEILLWSRISWWDGVIFLNHKQSFFFLKDPIYLQSVTIHSANGGKGEGWHVEEYSVALLC